MPLTQVKASFPVLEAANRHRAVADALKQWHYLFANTLTEEESLCLFSSAMLFRLQGGSSSRAHC